MYKILIIEDDEIVAEVYKDKLQAEGYHVEVAYDGESGYARLKAFEPDLLLLDMMVPKLAGVDILRRLRGKNAPKYFPTIAFSGSEEMLADAKILGAARVFSKSELVPNQIVARITEVVAAQRAAEKSEAVFTKKLAPGVHPAGRVLIVEDDPIIMQLVKDLVEEEGYTAVSAQDGARAYRILQRDHDFVAGIFDVRTPAIQGTDLLRHMQTKKQLAKIPVLIMTGEQSATIQSESFSAGAVIFLPKPFTRVTLRTMFRTLVSTKVAKFQPASI